jgi:hypothetical protein
MPRTTMYGPGMAPDMRSIRLRRYGLRFRSHRCIPSCVMATITTISGTGHHSTCRPFVATNNDSHTVKKTP